MVKNSGRRSSLSQERSVRSREALVEAATDLWSEEGFDAVKVEHICERAGLSKGLFYFYFGSKDDLLVELLLLDADEVAVAVRRAIDAGEPVESVVQKAVAVMVRRAQKRPQHLLARGVAEWFAALERHSAMTVGHEPLDATLAAAFAHGQARGEVTDDYSADELGGVLAVALLRAELEWATSASRQPSLVKRLWGRAELILRGAAP